MGEHTGIEWTDHTYNPWWGCIKVSDGCKFCYAEAVDRRFEGGHWGPNTERKLASEKYKLQLAKWNKKAGDDGVIRKVFVASMADIFENHPDVVDSRNQLFLSIDKGEYPNLIFQFLTKRIENVSWMVPASWMQNGFPRNVWIGTTIENDTHLDQRVHALSLIPAVVRFVSYEPALGYLTRLGAYMQDLTHTFVKGTQEAYQRLRGIQWVICGGESGLQARPIHPAWPRQMRDICKRYDVPFFFKQWGEFMPQPDHRKVADYNGKCLYVHENGSLEAEDGTNYGAVRMQKVGKGVSGAELDGVFHKQFPITNKQYTIPCLQ